MSIIAGSVYGLEVPPGEHTIDARDNIPLTIRITMAAIDPTAYPEPDKDGRVPEVPRSTLRLVKHYGDDDDDDLDGYLGGFLGGEEESESDDDDDEPNGGPSDLSKVKKAKTANGIKEALGSIAKSGNGEHVNGIKVNGTKSAKMGKGKAIMLADEVDDGSSDSDFDDIAQEQFVVCTLDTEKHFQQPLDLTIRAHEHVTFTVSGTHTIYLTGNYLLDDNDSEEDSDDDEYAGTSRMNLDDETDSMDESDILDDLDDPRIIEMDSDDDLVAPDLVPTLVDEAASQKGKNKRAAEADLETLDDLITKDKDVKPEAAKPETAKLTKRQKKKLKNNKGDAIVAEEEKLSPKDAAKADRKVQFASELEQGPTGSAEKAGKSGKAEKAAKAAKAEKAENAENAKPAPVLATKHVQGVTTDDRKIGTGRLVKNGDKVGVRYIGKLLDGKVFDANKKGKPFQFTVGKNEVIKGWDIGIIGMAVGGERRLTIPAKLAYGAKSMGDIPANSTLSFDIKLLEIK